LHWAHKALPLMCLKALPTMKRFQVFTLKQKSKNKDPNHGLHETSSKLFKVSKIYSW
jgi:hypothetical protein